MNSKLKCTTMASLKKRGKYYSIVFKKRVDGKPIRKTYALGTKYKKVADHKKSAYEMLYEKGEIDPFDDNWNLKEYEKSKESSSSTVSSNNFFLEDLKDQFLQTKIHLTAPTQKAYKSVTKLFIEDVGKTMPIGEVNDRDIRNFCIREDLSNASQRSYLRHLKPFFNWLEDEGHIKENPCDKVQPPKKKDKLVEKILTEQDLKKVFKKFMDYQKAQREAGHIKDSTQMQSWFKPLITFAFYTGMRRKEIINLRWEQVNLEEGEIHVTDTKNGRERTVTIFDQVYYGLKEWRKFNGNPQRGLVFPSPRSTKRIEIKLEPNNVSRVFKKHAKKAKLKSTINFHGLRHSNATYRLREGYDVIVVKDELGHRSIEVTNRYVHLVSKDRKEKAKQRGHITYM